MTASMTAKRRNPNTEFVTTAATIAWRYVAYRRNPAAASARYARQEEAHDCLGCDARPSPPRVTAPEYTRRPSRGPEDPLPRAPPRRSPGLSPAGAAAFEGRLGGGAAQSGLTRPAAGQ